MELERIIGRTSVVRRNLNPVWDETFVYYALVHLPTLTHSLDLEMNPLALGTVLPSLDPISATWVVPSVVVQTLLYLVFIA